MEHVEAQTQAEPLTRQAAPMPAGQVDSATGQNLDLIAKTLHSLSPNDIRFVLQQLDPRLLLDALQSSLPETAERAESTPQQAPEVQAPVAKQTTMTRVLKSGKLIYNNSSSVVDCQIREISDSGCKIRVENSMGIPEHPVLQILDGKTKRQCQVAWKKLEEIGLEFID